MQHDEYGMYGWVHDVPKGTRIIYENVLSLISSSNPNLLEIGTYVGTSIIEMLKLVKNSKATVIDVWKLTDLEKNQIQFFSKGEAKINLAYNKFLENIKVAGVENRITIIKEDSLKALIKLYKEGNSFDFIYVDGSHHCLDVLGDLIFSWLLLKKGGILAIDDYLWNVKKSILDVPKEAVDYFLEKYKGEYTILSKQYRIFLLKIV